MDPKELKQLFDSLNSDWKEFREANDARLKKLEDGSGVAEISEKLEKIGGVVDDTQAKYDQVLAGMKAAEERVEELEGKLDAIGLVGTDGQPIRKDLVEYRAKFEEWMRSTVKYGGASADPALSTELIKLAKEIPEYKDIGTGTGAAGGFAVPEVIARDIADQVRVLSPLRDVVRVVTVGTSDYKELVNIHGEDSGWVGETDTRTGTNTPQLRERAPTMGTLYAYPKATEESMDDIFFDVGAFLTDNVAELFAIEEGTAVITGDGTNKPTGILDGTPTTDDDDASPARSAEVIEYFPIGSGSPVSALDPDAFFDIVYGLKEQYAMNATWLMNRSVTGQVRKLKDGNDQYLWAPGLVAGEPNQFLGHPHRAIGAMSNLVADAHPVLFGDFRRGYLMVDRVGLRITVDANITTPGYIKWYIRRRVGGIIKDNNAIKAGKYATS